MGIDVHPDNLYNKCNIPLCLVRVQNKFLFANPLLTKNNLFFGCYAGNGCYIRDVTVIMRIYEIS